VTPSFISKIIKEYTYAYSSGSINNITPLDIKKVRSVIANHMTVEKELVETVIAMQPGQIEAITNFFEVLT
jgi:hypothetical protein